MDKDQQSFLRHANEILRTYTTPGWAKKIDRSEPIFQNWNMKWKLIDGATKDPTVRLGDTFEITVYYFPVVRLDGDKLVQLWAGNTTVMREEKGKAALITGLDRYFSIRAAKNALTVDDRITIRLTFTLKCVSVVHGNKFAVIGETACSDIKL